MEKTPTFRQIEEQEERELEPSILVSRSSGVIEAARLTDEYDEHGRRLAIFPGGREGKMLTPASLSDERQAALAVELAESAGRSPEQWERYPEAATDLGVTAVEAVVEIERKPVVTKPENITRATEELERSLGGKLAKLFEDYTTPEARRMAVDPNTGNAELRKQVYEVLYDRINELGHEGRLPERLQRNDPNDEKSVPDQRLGYERAKYPPREYAALVALAMIDGSFNGDPRKRTYEDLPADDPRNGQHRQTALMTLESFGAEKLPDDQSVEQINEKSDEWRMLERRIHEVLDGDNLNMLQREVAEGAIADSGRFNMLLNGVMDDLGYLRRIILSYDSTSQDEMKDIDEIQSAVGSVMSRLDMVSQDVYNLRGLDASGNNWSRHNVVENVLQETNGALRRLNELRPTHY